MNDMKSKGFLRKAVEDDEKSRLIRLLVKAVGLIEEAYERNFELLHPDNSLEYKEMIEVLNKHGINYRGKKEILELAMKHAVSGIAEKNKGNEAIPVKHPMKKALGKKNEEGRGHEGIKYKM
jgi:hypothetical protein